MVFPDSLEAEELQVWLWIDLLKVDSMALVEVGR
jgi:hypothetical protein